LNVSAPQSFLRLARRAQFYLQISVQRIDLYCRRALEHRRGCGVQRRSKSSASPAAGFHRYQAADEIWPQMKILS
jgi:hypothetical protein